MSRLHLYIADGIATIELDNPARLNVLTSDMLRQLAAYCRQLESDDTVRAVLLTARGDRAFCAGADIREWSALTPEVFFREWIQEGNRVFDRLAGLAKPTIAVLNGDAFGGGLELAIACDMRIMAPNATLALPEASVGVVPGWSGTQRMQRLLPEPVIKEMALFGRRLSAQRAYELGLVAGVAENPLQAALAVVTQSKRLSPLSTEVIKYMIHAGAGDNHNMLIDVLASGVMAGSADKAGGVQAFLEKRQADFSGIKPPL